MRRRLHVRRHFRSNHEESDRHGEPDPPTPGRAAGVRRRPRWCADRVATRPTRRKAATRRRRRRVAPTPRSPRPELVAQDAQSPPGGGHGRRSAPTPQDALRDRTGPARLAEPSRALRATWQGGGRLRDASPSKRRDRPARAARRGVHRGASQPCRSLRRHSWDRRWDWYHVPTRKNCISHIETPKNREDRYGQATERKDLGPPPRAGRRG